MRYFLYLRYLDRKYMLYSNFVYSINNNYIVKLIRCLGCLCFILVITGLYLYFNSLLSNVIYKFMLLHVLYTIILLMFKLYSFIYNIFFGLVIKEDKLFVLLLFILNCLVFIVTELFGFGFVLLDIFNVFIEFLKNLFNDKFIIKIFNCLRSFKKMCLYYVKNWWIS